MTLFVSLSDREASLVEGGKLVVAINECATNVSEGYYVYDTCKKEKGSCHLSYGQMKQYIKASCGPICTEDFVPPGQICGGNPVAAKK